MENLVGRKVKCLTSRWDDLTLNKVYDINKETHFNFYITNDDLFQDEFSKHHLDNSSFELLIDEPQFKQGDKVLFTDDLVNWEKGVFLVKHDESYIVESDEMLLYAIEIKPYEEEIKVGDWYLEISNNVIRKATNAISENYLKNKNYCKKITDEVLINKLNEL